MGNGVSGAAGSARRRLVLISASAGRHRQPEGRRRPPPVREARRAPLRPQRELERRGVHSRGRRRGGGVHGDHGEASAPVFQHWRRSGLNLRSPQLRAGNRAVRIKRVKEPLLLTVCSAAATSAGGREEARDVGVQRFQNSLKSEAGANLKLDPELYEGVVTQTIIEPSVNTSVCWCESEESPDGLWSSKHIQ